MFKPSSFRITYLVLGVWGAHLLHISRFRLVGWSHISALPDYPISLCLSFWLSLLLIPLVVVISILLLKNPKLWMVIACFVLSEAASQVLGRSLIKFVVDLGLWGTLVGNYIIDSFYGSNVAEYSRKSLSVLHSEMLVILRIMVTGSLFVVGTLGITVASNIISRYFNGELGQGTAWCYIGSIIYLAFGMFFLLILPLFKTIVQVREQIVADCIG